MRHRPKALYGCLCGAATLAVLCVQLGNPAHAQTAVVCPTLRGEAKPMFFDVASIRPSLPNEDTDVQVLPDGFLFQGGALRGLIRHAYDPEGFVGQKDLRNAPDWVSHEYFTLMAKVSPDDAAEWQRETSGQWDSPVLRCALRQLLAERCKLKLHTLPVDADGFALVLARSGLKKGLEPVEKEPPGHPAGPSPNGSETTKFLSENVMVERFLREPISQLTMFMSRVSSFMVEDKTGLDGDYNFTVRDNMPIRPTAEEREAYRLPTQRWDLQPLGLRLVRTKVHMTALVIDHIEMPSSN